MKECVKRIKKAYVNSEISTFWKLNAHLRGQFDRNHMESMMEIYQHVLSIPTILKVLQVFCSQWVLGVEKTPNLIGLSIALVSTGGKDVLSLCSNYHMTGKHAHQRLVNGLIWYDRYDYMYILTLMQCIVSMYIYTYLQKGWSSYINLTKDYEINLISQPRFHEMGYIFPLNGRSSLRIPRWMWGPLQHGSWCIQGCCISLGVASQFQRVRFFLEKKRDEQIHFFSNFLGQNFFLFPNFYKHQFLTWRGWRQT